MYAVCVDAEDLVTCAAIVQVEVSRDTPLFALK